MGLGSSAALAVAVSRVLLEAAGRRATPGRVAGGALRMEQSFHGTPSGVDHTCSAWGTPILFRRATRGRAGRGRRVRPRGGALLGLGLGGARRGAQPAGA